MSVTIQLPPIKHKFKFKKDPTLDEAKEFIRTLNFIRSFDDKENLEKYITQEFDKFRPFQE